MVWMLQRGYFKYILFVYSGASGLGVFFIRFFVFQGRKITQGGGEEYEKNNCHIQKKSGYNKYRLDK